MDSFILVKADGYNGGDVELIGVWNTYKEAYETMVDVWEDEVRRCIKDGCFDEDEKHYACFIEDNFAQVAGPHDRDCIVLRVFDAFNDAWINN